VACVDGVWTGDAVQYVSNMHALIKERDVNRWSVAIKRLAPLPDKRSLAVLYCFLRICWKTRWSGLRDTHTHLLH
jgi:hypothetical protein